MNRSRFHNTTCKGIVNRDSHNWVNSFAGIAVRNSCFWGFGSPLVWLPPKTSGVRESHTHYPPDERAYTAGAGITAWACKQWDCERFSWCGIVSVCLAEKAVPVRRLLCLERKQSKYSELLSLETCSFVRTLNSTTTRRLVWQCKKHLLCEMFDSVRKFECSYQLFSSFLEHTVQ